MVVRITDEYLKWLIDLICQGTSKYKYNYYKALLKHLFIRPYHWDILLDENQEVWAYKLREMYEEETGMKPSKDGFPISMLEMMIELAIRMENDMSSMKDEDFFEHVSDWFWGMVQSMGLYSNDDSIYNKKKTDMAIDKVLNHGYSYNGKGGMFTLEENFKNVDLRKVDLYYQSQLYMTELYRKKGHGDWLVD